MNDFFLQNIKVSQFQNDCEANDCLLSAKISDQMMTRLKRIIEIDHPQWFGMFTVEQFLVECRRNDLLRMFVASQISKDAKKQNKTEQILCDFLNGINWDWQFSILPKSGKNSISFQNSAVKLKSLDLVGVNGSERIFITHKYTNSQGGAQDGIKMELELMASCWNSNNGRLAIICDGDYWEHPKHLHFFSQSSNNVIICRHNELVNFI